MLIQFRIGDFASSTQVDSIEGILKEWTIYQEACKNRKLAIPDQYDGFILSGSMVLKPPISTEGEKK